jgi:hypothetical protein
MRSGLSRRDQCELYCTDESRLCDGRRGRSSCALAGGAVPGFRLRQASVPAKVTADRPGFGSIDRFVAGALNKMSIALFDERNLARSILHCLDPVTN